MYKKTKSVLSIVLALALIIGSFVFPAANAGALTAIEPVKSNGVYLLSNSSELLWASQNLKNNYVLTADINAGDSVVSIGTAAEPFSGSFNGAGHKITVSINQTVTDDNYYYFGLFGCVSGTVTNLTVDGSVTVKLTKGCVGGVAAALLGGTVDNCTSNVSIQAQGTGVTHVGGIVGAVRQGASSKVINCVNNGAINNTVSNTASGNGELEVGTQGTTGGIVSFICDTSGADISKCINNGKITVTGGKENIGGIVGQTSSNNNSTYVNITYCANKGDITGYNIQGERAAGIIGYDKSGKINYCYNTGNIIEYTDSGSAIARQGYGNYFGIFGYANLSASNKLEVTYCYNASPSPLEAEICVVRNPGNGTFKNFYMSGRTEYETVLKSEATAGTAGTTFSDANDLYTKITATEAGAAAYAQNPEGGYPVLAFENTKELSTDSYNGFIDTQTTGSLLHSLYCILVVNNSVNTNIAASAVLSDGSKVIANQTLTAVDSVRAGGVTYVAAESCKLYAVSYNSLSDDLWSTLTLSASKSNTQVFSLAVKSEELFANTGVDVPFENMPNYPDGTISNIYNSGPGLANDKTSVTDTDSKMVIISSTGDGTFISYVERLLAKGFTKLSERIIDGNIYYSLAYNGKYYYVYYTDYAKQVRIIEDNSSNILLSELDTDALGANGTELYQYSIDYTEGEGQTSVYDYWKIDCGMMYILKFADNSIFMIDGGHDRQCSNYMLETLNDFLYEITDTPADQKVNIKGWYTTHAHGDHVYLTHAFLEKYHDNYNLEATLFNIPSYQTMSGGYDSGTFLMKDTINQYYPDCKNVKLHTGQTFDIQGVNFDVWFTHEDATNAGGTTKISDFNATSTVIKITIGGQTLALLGDISTVAEQEILHMFKPATLKCNAVQAAHHGFNDVASLYNAIAANLALVPNSEANSGANSGNASKFNAMMNAGQNTVALFAEKYTYKLTVADGAFTYEALPSYRDSINYFKIPDLDISLIPDKAEPAVDLNTVLAKKPLLDFIIDKSANGTAAASTKEGGAMMLDGKTSTKFCTKTTPAVVAWNMKEPVTLSAYVLYTANDNGENPGRNPKNWVLCGSNDGENWNVIDAVSNGNLPDTNYTGVAFTVDSPAAYQYYVIKFFSTNGAAVLQISDIGLYADVDPDPDPDPDPDDFILGDMDNDKARDVSDVVALRKIIIDAKPTADQIKRGDIDKDEKLTVSDVVALRSLIMKG